MSTEIILKLLKSTNEDDILIAISMIAELEDPRAFFREHGTLLNGACDGDAFDSLGPRHKMDINTDFSENYYHKITDNFYLLTKNSASSISSRYISECFTNYSDEIKVIDYEY